MSELFIEIGVEEMPVAEISTAVNYLLNSLQDLFKSEHIHFKEIKTFSTPRRLAFYITEISDKSEPSIITYTGPKKESAFDNDGNPTQAAIGFARSKGVDIKLLKPVKLDKGEFVQVQVKKPGIPTKTLLRKNLRELFLGIPFSKTMRWGIDDIRFIRPIRWLTILYNDKVLSLSIGNIKAGLYTYGLRIGSKNPRKITSFDTWQDVLKKDKIIPDAQKRKDKIRKESLNLAKKLNGEPLDDPKLLDTITNLVESPVAIVGSFDKRFMNLPEEVIVGVMKIHQKYIPILKNGKLIPYFIGISNNPYGNRKIIRKGYERVLTARLEDAEFYYNQDIKKPLESYIELLKGIVFFPTLGSLYNKTQRIVNVSSFICDMIKTNEQTMELLLKAAKLYKADLATRLVSEFPELQGIIGAHYVLKQDEKNTDIANIIKEQYNLPTSLSSAIVYIADKIDTIVGFFGIGQVPTGTQDPYGLRRAAIGIINAIFQHRIELNIKNLIEFSFDTYNNLPEFVSLNKDKSAVSKSVLSYLYGRLEGVLQERFYSEESLSEKIRKLINAVIATEPHNILEVNLRIHGLKDIVFKKEFEPILLAFKRILNITKNHPKKDVFVDLLVELPEKVLYDKYLEIQPKVLSAIAKRNYIDYINQISILVNPINTFFDKVLVMTDDEKIRNNRLNLLANIKNLVMEVVDITKLF